ncbi:hypothetical protein [Colwellia sp. MB02u-14]|uniref:hypothetical protein n=1 Tax=Colwellia sp. MB02u-14 TaxID=2759815 RepID=UPI0015F3C290|nr:hypothetical protein [Colwellia sp. MB02u-14]MBA6304672.1 hypothetical protein [Colwellia sp. MB02u-14]
MDNEEIINVETQLELERISELQRNKVEFEKLGDSGIGFKDLFAILVSFGLLLAANSFFTIDSELFQILAVILFAVPAIQGIVKAESNRTNRRMDLLLKIIKQEQSKNT